MNQAQSQKDQGTKVRSFSGSTPNIVDRVIGVFSPEAAVRRLCARDKLREFGYDGARQTTERGKAQAAKNQSPETTEMQRDIVQLIWESREMHRNLPLVNGTVNRLCEYTISRLAYKSRCGDRKIEKAYEDYLHSWSGRSDWSGRFRFRKQVELALRGMILDGDHLLLPLRETKKEGFGEVRLQNVEGDRVGDPHRLVLHKPRGLVIGERGEIVNFEVFKRSTVNRYEKDLTVEAERALFLVDPFRADMYRGVPLMGPAMPRVRDLYEAIKLEMVAAKAASGIAAFTSDNVAGEGPQWDPAPVDPKEDAARLKSLQGGYEVIPGRTVHIPRGAKLDLAPGTVRPTGAFQVLIDVLARELAQALNTPFGFVYRMGELGGVTQRVEVMQLQRRLEYFRQLLTDLILDPVRDLVLAEGIAEGKIPAHPNYKVGVWQWGAHLTADVGHDTNARATMLQMGLTNKTREAAMHGEDYGELVVESAGEVDLQRDIAEEHNIPVEMLCGGQEGATELLAGKAEGEILDEQGAAAAAPPVEAPKPGIVGKFGAKESKPLLDVIREYNKGLMQREEALSALVSLYGMDMAEADGLLK